MSRERIKLLALVWLMCCIGTTISPPPPPPPQPVEFPEYVLAVEWPVSYCYFRGQDCIADPRRLPSTFSLHGLWPVGAPAKTGKIQEFKFKKLPVWLKKRLKLDFFSVRASYPQLSEEVPKAYLNFWKDEWNKHGNESGLGQSEYFGSAIKLLDEVNRKYGGLRTNFPPGGLIDLDNLGAAFDGLGMRPMLIRCFYDSTRKKVFITELQFKVENIPGNLKIRSAPLGRYRDCGEGVKKMAYLATPLISTG